MDAKSAKLPQKAYKNRSKTCKKGAKNGKKPLAHLTNGTPSAEKSPRTLAPRPMGSKKSPKNYPQNLLQKVIHNRRLP